MKTINFCRFTKNSKTLFPFNLKGLKSLKNQAILSARTAKHSLESEEKKVSTLYVAQDVTKDSKRKFGSKKHFALETHC